MTFSTKQCDGKKTVGFKQDSIIDRPNVDRTFGIRFENQSAASKVFFWPGRFEPCNMSIKEEKLLQNLVTALNSPDLTSPQRQQVHQDLQIVAHRALCKGFVSPGPSLSVEIRNCSITCDALDLAMLLAGLNDREITVNDFLKLENNKKLNQGCPIHPGQLITRKELTLENFCKADARPVIENSYFREMRGYLQGCSKQEFNLHQKQCAKRVVDQLPIAARGALKDIPAELISLDAYLAVIRKAANDSMLPKPLQDFRDANNSDDPRLKDVNIAIYSNPYIAIKILGLSVDHQPSQFSNSEFSKQLVGKIFSEFNNTNPFKVLVGIFKGEPSVSSEYIFNKLGEQEILAAQNMVKLGYVPDKYSGVLCPECTVVQVQKSDENLEINANHVSLGNGQTAIAAMQPIYTGTQDAKNLAAFFRMISQDPHSFVVDLRSESDLMGAGNYDYCPQVGAKLTIPASVKGGDIEVETLALKDHPDTETQEVTLKLTIDGNSKEISILQFRAWPDHSVVTPSQLKKLRQLVLDKTNEGGNPIVHCRAGVGRTGTLLTYTKLYQQLIKNGEGEKLINKHGVVSKLGLKKAVATAVAEGRLERGPLFVQDVSQFKLIVDTLEKDLSQADFTKKTPPKVKPDVSASPVDTTQKTAPQQASVSALWPQANRVNLTGQQAVLMTKESQGFEELQKHWQAVLAEGKSVVEIVSDPNKLAFADQLSASGVNFIKEQLAEQLLKSGSFGLSLGEHSILSVTAVESPENTENSLSYTQKFRIQYRSTLADGSLSEPRNIEYTQVYTPFDGKKLSSDQLDELVTNLYSAKDKPTWMVSVRGVGRPSAVWMAKSIRSEIAKGAIANESQLKQKMAEWIKEGRRDHGPLFVHTREQYAQLLEFGLKQLSAGQSSAPANLQNNDKKTHTSSNHFAQLVERIKNRFSERFQTALQAQGNKR